MDISAGDLALPAEQVSVEDIMSGGESSLELKRLAKAVAWANGSAPKKTTHRLFQGDAREMRELAEPVHLVVTSPPYFNLIDYEGDAKNGQLGDLDEYTSFLAELDRVWHRCFDLLVPGGRRAAPRPTPSG